MSKSFFSEQVLLKANSSSWNKFFSKQFLLIRVNSSSQNKFFFSEQFLLLRTVLLLGASSSRNKFIQNNFFFLVQIIVLKTSSSRMRFYVLRKSSLTTVDLRPSKCLLTRRIFNSVKEISGTFRNSLPFKHLYK